MHTASVFICDHQLSSIRDLNIYQSDVLWQIFVDTSIKWVHILKEHMAIFFFYPLCNICSQREHEQSWLKMHMHWTENMSDFHPTNTFFILNEKESDDVVFVITSSSENYIKQHQRSEYYDECEYCYKDEVSGHIRLIHVGFLSSVYFCSLALAL